MLLSTWEWIRICGFLAYFYFTVSIIFGLLRKSPAVKSHKNLLFQLHQSAGWFGFAAVIVHMLLLIVDQYEPYRIAELLIPFASDYEPVLSGLGTIAFYLFLMVFLSSDLWLRKMGFSLWKKVHFAVLPAWVISLVHGVLIGTDTVNPFILLFYWSTATFVFIFSLIRIISGQYKKKEKEVKVKPVEV
ncbi:ferric reductase like protein [Ureibacillus xyleni]|uniref:Ferric reductase like protein n=1 Tax=Ureibacillus xyleni TaxID=614648 RepID=A0A285TJW3_9BACL|nr:ferric reductase-like transmembrane domain-containing protein [Ureibacillus xyleni]SOC22464.1 ferric reductase like protein [Ureibacillus xyleni]